ncbi:hypothetical protein BN946_scf185037.g9 [Trametes cinnabarina]|uniref:Uncharacterized protein n=1 Tax=Pycnoporus cinnabarinus TaxID=5643 RepID=A0A060SPT7_PYCCI|nr:hypothetical protein BN946_scf185037.g9 [Trametes cinnabarina]
MQRRTSQTFQRLRKLSDSLIQAIVPSSKQGDGDSFMELKRKDSRQALTQTSSADPEERSGTRGDARREREKPLPEPPREERRRERPEPSKAFNAFMTPATASSAASAAHSRPREDRRPREEVEREGGRAHAEPPSARSRHAGVRRISSSGDVHLPPQHSRYRHGQRDENASPRERGGDHLPARLLLFRPLSSLSPPRPSLTSSRHARF